MAFDADAPTNAELGVPYVMDVNHLIEALHAAGVRAGMTLMVHSSLKSLGHMTGGAPAVVQALMDAVRPGGTVLFPAITFNGSLTQFLQQHHSVDLRRSPPAVGAIPRAAALHPLARRSLHPTHPVIAIGPAADALFSGRQSGQGPCGTQSPFYKAAMSGGYILLIGVTNSVNTTLHCAEELAAPYMNHLEVFTVRTTDDQGRRHGIQVKGYPVGIPRRFDAINQRLLESGILSRHRLGAAEAWLIDARRMLESVIEWLAKEPCLLLDPDFAKASRP